MDIYFNYTKFCGSLLKLARGFEVNKETFYHPTYRTIKIKLSIIGHSRWKKFLQCDFTTKDNFIKYGVCGSIVKRLFILVHASFKST